MMLIKDSLNEYVCSVLQIIGIASGLYHVGLLVQPQCKEIFK